MTRPYHQVFIVLALATCAAGPALAQSRSGYEICYDRFMDDNPSNDVTSWKESKLERYRASYDQRVRLIETQKQDWVDDKTKFVLFASIAQKWEARADEIFDPRLEQAKREHDEIVALIEDRAADYFGHCREAYDFTGPETLEIPADGTKVSSRMVLRDGERYRLTVTGTFQYDQGEAGTRADAQHYEDDDHHFVRNDYVAVNGAIRPADAQIGEHAFEYWIEGADGPLVLHIDDSGYNDNDGSLTAVLALESSQ